MFNIHFTKSNKIGSRIIRKVTGEDVSHCVLEKNGIVLHSTFTGVEIVPLRVFKEENTILYTISGTKTDVKFAEVIDKYWGAKYDFFALLGLGIRLLWPRLMPKRNLWQVSGMFLCTEFVTSVLGGRENSEITPYKLYLRLKEQSYE